MPINEFIIWVSLGALAVGLDKVTTNLAYGLILCAVGVAGSAYGIREHYLDSNANWSRIVAAFVIVVTWSAVGYDIYDRHAGAISTPTAASVVTLPTPKTTTEIAVPNMFGGQSMESLYLAFPELGWSAHQLTEVRDKHFVGKTLPLDGYVYIHCSFKDVIFDYSGTDLTGGWVDAKFEGSTVRIGSRNAILLSYLALYQSANISLNNCDLTSEAPPIKPQK